jgi:hypothetical protein
MTKDDQLHLFPLYKIKEFPRAGEQLLFVVIVWPGLTILGEESSVKLHEKGALSYLISPSLWGLGRGVAG